jgi:hypothetical protein
MVMLKIAFLGVMIANLWCICSSTVNALVGCGVLSLLGVHSALHKNTLSHALQFNGLHVQYLKCKDTFYVI